MILSYISIDYRDIILSKIEILDDEELNYFLALIEIYTTINEEETKEEVRKSLNSQNSSLPKVNFKTDTNNIDNTHLNDVTVRKLEKIKKSTKSIKKVSHLSIKSSRVLSEISKN